VRVTDSPDTPSSRHRDARVAIKCIRELTKPSSPPRRCLWVCLFLLLPLCTYVGHSFWIVRDGILVHQWNLQNYRALFTNPLYFQVFLRTARIAGSVTLCSVLLGYPLAYYLSFYAGPRKELLYQLVIVPLWGKLPRSRLRMENNPRQRWRAQRPSPISAHHARTGQLFSLQSLRRCPHAHSHLHAIRFSSHLRRALSIFPARS